MIWRLVAFLARCGHQQACDILEMPMSNILSLAFAIGALMREESDAARAAIHRAED